MKRLGIVISLSIALVWLIVAALGDAHGWFTP